MTNLHVAYSSSHVLTVITDVHLNDVECRMEGEGGSTYEPCPLMMHLKYRIAGKFGGH